MPAFDSTFCLSAGDFKFLRPPVVVHNKFKGFACACEHTTSKDCPETVSEYLFMLSFSNIGGRFSYPKCPLLEAVLWIQIRRIRMLLGLRALNNPDHISESLEIILWVKILKLFKADPGTGMENNRIRDKHPGFATH